MSSIGEDRRVQVLDDGECRRLLCTTSIGRLAFTEGAMPAIRPVSFGVVRDQIVIPIRAGSRVAAASRGAVLAFEADALEAGSQTGWTVTVVGPSRVVADPIQIAELDALGLSSWTPTTDPGYVAVHMRIVRGLRVHAVTPASASAPT